MKDLEINIQNQSHRNQSPNLSTTNAPNLSYGTRRTPPLLSPLSCMKLSYNINIPSTLVIKFPPVKSRMSFAFK